MAGIVAMVFASSMVNHQATFALRILGIRMRVSGLLYNHVCRVFVAALLALSCLKHAPAVTMKPPVTSSCHPQALETSAEKVGQLSVGHVVNMLSNDTERVRTAVEYGYVVLTAPLEIILVIAIAWGHVGPACLGMLFWPYAATSTRHIL